MTSRLFPDEFNIQVRQVQPLVDLDYGQSPRFDFQNNEFVFNNNGDIELAAGLDNLRQWIYKAVKTPRYRYIIYTHQFGNEYEDLIGQSSSYKGFESLVAKLMRESLLFDDRIVNVTDMIVNRDTDNSNALIVSFKVVTTDNNIIDFSIDVNLE